MKRLFMLLFLGVVFVISVSAQNYDNILNYNSNSTPVNGVKIKTNLPFVPDAGMPTISIKGYNYGNADPINLTLTYYVWYSGISGDPNNYYFHNPKVSSSGSYTPQIFLSNESGKVVICINDMGYCQRFTVSAFGQGYNETPSWFQGWTVADESANGTKITEVSYRNRFKGDVYMPGDGIWNPYGNVGIGTLAPTEKLSVNGKIRAKEVKVEIANWPDFVFAKSYTLPTLQEIEAHIKEKGRLPGISSAEEVKANGVDLGDMNAKLLQKIEELTLHLIEKDKQMREIIKENALQKKDIQYLKSKLK